MTLYFRERLWWLSHCKYWFVCVGLWYTVMDKELSASGITKLWRKGIAPFPWVPSTVNIIAGSMILIWSRNACLWAWCWMTHVSSTNLYHTWGVCSRPEGFSLKMLNVQVGNYRVYGWAHSYSLNLLIEFIIEKKSKYYLDRTPRVQWCSELIILFCHLTFHPFPKSPW